MMLKSDELKPGMVLISKDKYGGRIFDIIIALSRKKVNWVSIDDITSEVMIMNQNKSYYWDDYYANDSTSPFVIMRKASHKEIHLVIEAIFRVKKWE